MFRILAALIVGLLFIVIYAQRPPCTQKDAAKVKACWEQVVQADIKRGDIAGAFESLVSLYNSAPNMGETCHALTHEIGRSGYKLFARDVKISITPKTAYCSYGFYHGFMEELVLEKGDMDLARKFCDYADAQLSKVSPDVTLQCFHGIGHGTVNNHDPRTWGNAQSLIDPAIALCEQVASSDEQLSRCATGVFNGLSIFYSTGEYKLVLDKNDPVKICRQQKKQYQDACYISMNTLLLQLTNYDLMRAVLFIEVISDDVTASHAMINLAAPIGTKNISKTDHTETISICRLVQKRLHLPCIAGYAYGFLEHGEPEREYIKPLKFCESESLTRDEQNACFEYILSYLPRWYAQEKVESICATLDGTVKKLCYEKI